MNISTLVKSLLIVALSASIEVSVQIRGSNGAEIQYMVVKFLDKKKHLFLGQTLSQQLFDRHLFISSYVMYF